MLRWSRMSILGCGWGSLTPWLAEHYPNARVTGVSVSRACRATIFCCVSRKTSSLLAPR